MANNPPASRSGLSLYANLLDPSKSAPGTISSAPVSYNRPSASTPEEDDPTKKQQALAASLRFQPTTKRPQLAVQKAKAKAIASKLSAIQKPPDKLVEIDNTSTPPPPPPPALSADTVKATTAVADWINTAEDDEDVNNYYRDTKAQRGGRKKRKKNNKDVPPAVQQDWDDIYDPTRPNSYEEYKHSDEKIREVREWKDLLYRHRMRRQKSEEYDSDDAYSMDTSRRNKQFAPPPMNFAPPSDLDHKVPPPPPPPDNDEYIPPLPGHVPEDVTGDDAFARRVKMSSMSIPPPSLPPPPPPPPDDGSYHPPTPQPPLGQIARAPVRYSLPAADPDLPKNEQELAEMDVDEEEEQTEDAARSLRPGQSKFAERLMAKYGWSKGQGLGKEGTGVTSALYAKADKRKKKSDAEGGGYVQPATIGRILGGTKSAAAREAETGKFGAMSEVVRLQGMLKGMNLQAEMSNEQGGIMQEIGEECSDKYGNVERVYIHSNTEEESGPLVFVHFTNQLSALRAVNALEGRVFNGNEIKARFWDKEKFEQGGYE